MSANCSYCGSYAVNIDPAKKLCNVHFYKVQRDELLEAVKALTAWQEAEVKHFQANMPDDWILAKVSAAIAKAGGAV